MNNEPPEVMAKIAKLRQKMTEILKREEDEEERKENLISEFYTCKEKCDNIKNTIVSSIKNPLLSTNTCSINSEIIRNNGRELNLMKIAAIEIRDKIDNLHDNIVDNKFQQKMLRELKEIRHDRHHFSEMKQELNELKSIMRNQEAIRNQMHSDQSNVLEELKVMVARNSELLGELKTEKKNIEPPEKVEHGEMIYHPNRDQFAGSWRSMDPNKRITIRYYVDADGLLVECNGPPSFVVHEKATHKEEKMIFDKNHLYTYKDEITVDRFIQDGKLYRVKKDAFGEVQLTEIYEKISEKELRAPFIGSWRVIKYRSVKDDPKNDLTIWKFVYSLDVEHRLVETEICGGRVVNSYEKGYCSPSQTLVLKNGRAIETKYGVRPFMVLIERFIQNQQLIIRKSDEKGLTSECICERMVEE